MTIGLMTCAGCGGVLPTHNAWCDVLRPRPVPAPAEPSAPCRVCEAAHAFCRSGAPASTADFIKSAIVQERKAKEKAEAERDRLRAALDAERKAHKLSADRMFPIMATSGRFALSIPWALIEPHEPQVRANHDGQTLERLAERGGLSAQEAWCAMNGMDIRSFVWGVVVTPSEAYAFLVEKAGAVAKMWVQLTAERERCARIVEAFENTDPERAITAAAAEIRSGK